MKGNDEFPHVAKSITQFLDDEEGNISRSKLLSIGSMMIIMGVLMSTDAFAAHRSHSSHSSHVSGSSSYHGSHVSHVSHVSSSTGSYGGGGVSNAGTATTSTNYASTTTPTVTSDSTNAVTATAQTIVPGWHLDSVGWWWQNADGTYPFGTWKWLDGNGDGIAESYCFDQNGYLYTNTVTPDGYTVDSNGCWILNGAVQSKLVN